MNKICDNKIIKWILFTGKMSDDGLNERQEHEEESLQLEDSQQPEESLQHEDGQKVDERE